MPKLGNIGSIAKAVTAALILLIGWATAVVSSKSGPITPTEWIGLGTVVATFLGVYSVPNQGGTP